MHNKSLWGWPAVAMSSSGFSRKVMLAILALLMCLAASAGNAQTLRLAVSRTALALPLYVAQEKGYFAQEGLDLQIADCATGSQCLKQVLDRHADIATSADLPIVLNAFERTDYAVIATFANTADDEKLVVRVGDGTNQPSQLAGKRIGVVIGTAAQYFLELYLLTIGVDPNTVTMVGLAPNEMGEALNKGQVDAIAIWEPYAQLAAKALGARARVLPRSGAYTKTFNLIVHRTLVGTRDASMVQLLRALARAERFIHEQPDEAKGILRRRLQLDQQLIDSVWPGLNFRLGLDQSLIATLESQARWAMRERHVKSKSMPNFPSLLHTAPLKSVNPGAVGVAR